MFGTLEEQTNPFTTTAHYDIWRHLRLHNSKINFANIRCQPDSSLRTPNLIDVYHFGWCDLNIFIIKCITPVLEHAVFVINLHYPPLLMLALHMTI